MEKMTKKELNQRLDKTIKDSKITPIPNRYRLTAERFEKSLEAIEKELEKRESLIKEVNETILAINSRLQKPIPEEISPDAKDLNVEARFKSIDALLAEAQYMLGAN